MHLDTHILTRGGVDLRRVHLDLTSITMYESDTDSEPDNSLPKWSAVDFAQILSTHANHDQPQEDWTKRVRAAIEALSSIDVQSVTKAGKFFCGHWTNLNGFMQDITHHSDIQEASSAVLSFIGNFIASGVPLDEAPEETLALFSSLRRCRLDPLFFYISPFSIPVKMSFISLLLKYRMAFHSLAAQQIPPGTAASPVICWVDVNLLQQLFQMEQRLISQALPRNSEKMTL